MKSLKVKIPLKDIKEHASGHEFTEDIGIQIKAIVGKEGDSQDDHVDMLTNLDLIAGNFIGYMEVSEPEVLDNLDSIKFRVKCYGRRDDGNWHIKPFANWLTYSLNVSVGQ